MIHPLLTCARRVIAVHLAGGSWRAEVQGLDPSPAQGCFVSLKLGRRLRGCIGTLLPSRATLGEEVAENALAAALRDPRFDPLLLEELGRVSISIDLLSVPEPVAGVQELDARRFGVVVRHGKRCGVLLPDIPGVSSAEEQIAICREKAGISARDPVLLERFIVDRLEE
jgi:AmmeMemoRadiSam system protein A